jgi:hypothetical protein
MTDDASPVLVDLAGAEQDAIVGGATLAYQLLGAVRSPRFDGVSAFAQAEMRAATRFRSAFTIEMQVQPDALTPYRRILGSGFDNANFGLTMNAGGAVRIKTGNKTADSTSVLSAAALKHVVVVWTGTEFRFYFNGVADPAVASAAPTWDSTYDDWPIFFGAADSLGTGFPNDFFAGYLRQVALYPGVLSANRIAAHAALMAGGAASSAETVPSSVQTASYVLTMADAGTVVEMNVAGANTLTVPPNASVAFPIGTLIETFQLGAGQTTITPGAGVTLHSDGNKLKTNAQYASVSLRKRAADAWVVAGDLSA